MPADGDAAAPASVHEVTCLLQAWGSGDETALALLMPVVYTERHRLAQRYMAAEPSHQTLETRAIVHVSADTRRTAAVSSTARPPVMRCDTELQLICDYMEKASAVAQQQLANLAGGSRPT